MSKTKFALLVFSVAFGVNLAAFLFSKKTFTVEEVKSLWIYEIPGTASPQDAYVAADLGPHQGFIGTLFMPDHLEGERGIAPFLVERWNWNSKDRALELWLKPGLRYQNGDPILPAHFLAFRDFLNERGVPLAASGVWAEWLRLKAEVFEGGLRFFLDGAVERTDFDLETFLGEVLTHPLSGAVHPANLEGIRSGKRLTKEWISSGPYKIRKWNPKEIVLVSRDDFPLRLPEPFFRTLKYQSAPVKNPSCDFLLGRSEEADGLKDHSRQDTSLELSVFWVCRSFASEGICKDANVRELVHRALSGNGSLSKDALQGRTVRYRIPVGSDAFRDRIRRRIEERMTAAGARVEETSFFFDESKNTDLELEFVVAPREEGGRSELAKSLALLSTRLGWDAFRETHLIGEVERFPLSIFMKKMKGGMFPKVFLEPDLDEKRLPL